MFIIPVDNYLMDKKGQIVLNNETRNPNDKYKKAMERIINENWTKNFV